ncbi:MAG: PHP domain-containing protein [Gammaproteobacteria bacterium]|nr:PHP domain-containing protein [Gammaproteobacteria bacterium]
MPLKIDLHCHTSESDGGLDCPQLIDRAAEKGVDVLSITDHDTTAVYPKAFEYASEQNIQLISGVEISAVSDSVGSDRGQEVHIVGLGVDINDETLQRLLEENRSRRATRADKILSKLEKAGFPNLDEQLSSLVKGKVICRSHLAKVILDAGLVKNFQGAFDKFLAKGKRAWVPIQWQGMTTVINAIDSAGGYAVLAHPTKYRLTEMRLGLLIDAFVEAGGKTIEMAYPGLNPNQRAMLVRQVEKHQLSVSQGSDFHYPGTSWTELGAFGVNPELFTAIWQQLDVMKAS